MEKLSSNASVNDSSKWTKKDQPKTCCVYGLQIKRRYAKMK